MGRSCSLLLICVWNTVLGRACLALSRRAATASSHGERSNKSGKSVSEISRRARIGKPYATCNRSIPKLRIRQCLDLSMEYSSLFHLVFVLVESCVETEQPRGYNCKLRVMRSIPYAAAGLAPVCRGADSMRGLFHINGDWMDNWAIRLRRAFR